MLYFVFIIEAVTFWDSSVAKEGTTIIAFPLSPFCFPIFFVAAVTPANESFKDLTRSYQMK